MINEKLMQQVIQQTEQRFCYKCHFPADAADANCRKCGSRALKTRAAIRLLGGLLIGLGGFISLMMAAVLSFMYKTFTGQNGAKFNGEEAEMLFAVGIVGLTFAVGLAFAAAGAWQLVFGRRNTVIVWISFAMIAAAFIAGQIFVFLHG